MAEKAYWEYRLKHPDSGWQRAPHVFAETAFFATQAAALVLQQERKDPRDWQPVHREQVEVRRVDLPLNWCVSHDQGSCVVRGKKGIPIGDAPGEPPVSVLQTRSWIGQSVPTLCNHYVNDVEHVTMGLPRGCNLCLKRLFELYWDRRSERTIHIAAILRAKEEYAALVERNVTRTRLGVPPYVIQSIWWLPDSDEVKLVVVIEGFSRQMTRVIHAVKVPGADPPTRRILLDPSNWERRHKLKWPDGFNWKEAVELKPLLERKKVSATPNVPTKAKVAKRQRKA